MADRFRVRWEAGDDWDPRPVEVKHRWFPWLATNVTFSGQRIYEGAEPGMNPPTMRHELTHIKQYRTRGRLWVWFHPGQREAEARAAEHKTVLDSQGSAYPHYELMP